MRFPKLLLPSLPQTEEEQSRLFKFSVFASVFLHVLLYAGLYWREHRGDFEPETHLMEIDFTKPFRIGGNPLLKPGGGTDPNLSPDKIGVPAPYDPKAEEKPKPKDWVIPGPNTKELEKPDEDISSSKVKSLVSEPGGTGQGFPGTGGGYGGGDGQGGGYPVTRWPKCLNAKEIQKLVRKHYPASELEYNMEGNVVLDLHIDVTGKVIGVEIVEAPTEGFRDVSQKLLAPRMKFSPAFIDKTPVATTLRYTLFFRLTD